VQPIKAKVQQGSAWTEAPKDIAKERDEQREVRRTFKILREVWLNIRIEKIDIHKGIMVKVLLDSSTIGMFMDRKIAARHSFKLQRLERPVVVKNVDRMNNSAGVIIHQVEVNVYYNNYIKKIRMDTCDLERTEVILGMLWLQTYNLEINWETEEVKMIRCPPLCGRNTKKKEDKKAEKRRRIATIEEEKIVR